MTTPYPGAGLSIGFFVTCAVDLLRPSVAFSAIRLLADAGCTVSVPEQSCCGQVAYNNGLTDEARRQALQVVAAFESHDYIVAPSGSCASMLKNHYPGLFEGTKHEPRVQNFADKVYELTCFLAEMIPDAERSDAAETTNGEVVAYHDSCAGLRELGIRQQPRALLGKMCNVEPVEVADGDSCCGFGGTFCVKFDEISNRMVTDKANRVAERDPDVLLGGDLTCLMNIAGKLRRQGNSKIRVRHIAEYLANDRSSPAIGEPE